MSHQEVKQKSALPSIQAAHRGFSPKSKSHPRSFIQDRIPLTRILFVCSLLFADNSFPLLVIPNGFSISLFSSFTNILAGAFLAF